MTDTYLDLVKGTISAIKGDTPLTNIVGTRVYTDVPQKETFPYSVVRVQSRDFSTKTFSGMDHTLEIHCFSREKSPFECADFRKKLVELLNRSENSITLDNGTMSDLQYETAEIFREPDGVTWHSFIQFRAIIT
jgi:hypothetical protein